jgi:hypothetical protein
MEVRKRTLFFGAYSVIRKILVHVNGKPRDQSALSPDSIDKHVDKEERAPEVSNGFYVKTATVRIGVVYG